MTSIHFYHLTTTPLERALPKLLEKTISSGYKALVVADSESRVEQLNQLLWTYDPNSFLPHGSVNDGEAEHQPILLSTAAKPLNSATILIVIDGRRITETDGFEKLLDIFDGNDPEMVEQARNRWTEYKKSGYSLSYHKQTETGGWTQKAVA